MGFDKMSPGCGCCGDCNLLTDSFDRDDSTNIGASWTEESGDWEISNNQLITSSTNAIAVLDLQDPESGELTVNAKGASGDIVRCFLDDQIFRHWLEIEIGTTSKVRYYLDSNIKHEVEVNTISADTFFEMKLCYHHYGTSPCYRFTGYIDGELLVRRKYNPGFGGCFTVLRTAAGLGTGSTASDVAFDDFAWSAKSPYFFAPGKECPKCLECCFFPLVSDETDCANVEWTVDLSGVTTDNCGADCTTLDGEYVLTKTTATGCGWTIESGLPEINCGGGCDSPFCFLEATFLTKIELTVGQGQIGGIDDEARITVNFRYDCVNSIGNPTNNLIFYQKDYDMTDASTSLSSGDTTFTLDRQNQSDCCTFPATIDVSWAVP